MDPYCVCRGDEMKTVVKESLRVAAVSLNTTPLDFAGNYELLRQALKSEQTSDADIVLFPELCIPSYGCQDYFFYPKTEQSSLHVLRQLIDVAPEKLLLVGLAIRKNQKLYNCAAYLYSGKVLGIRAKTMLANGEVYYEPRWFEPWPQGVNESYTLPSGESVLFGDFVLDFAGWKVGTHICEEGWSVTQSPLLEGVDLILNPSASHYTLDKLPRRQAMIVGNSKRYNCYYVYTNMSGLESGRILYDGGEIFAAPCGLIHSGERIQYEPVQVESVDLRKSDLRAESVTDICTNSFAEKSKFEHFEKAIAIGLADYMRKTHLRGFVVSLSGGVDSFVTAYMVYAMVRLGEEELSKKGFWEHIGRPQVAEKEGLLARVAEVLHCIYQATENSSKRTKDAAQLAGAAFGATFEAVSVQKVWEQYRVLAESVLSEPLSFEDKTGDLTLQNMQARVRSILPWTVANQKNFLLLTTSNRSESAVGYCTMDGDTSGGVAPIAGVSKIFLQKFVQFIANHADTPESLREACIMTLSGAPTAELRPISSSQEDEKDLMPYASLERITESFLQDRVWFDEIKESAEHVDKYQSLFFRSQWKRDRIAPSFHAMDASLDPQGYARFPTIAVPTEVSDET